MQCPYFASPLGLDKAQDNPLTAREGEILRLVAKGMSNKEISSKLDISEHTVKNHLKNILQKLHLDNRVQLARYAYEHSWMGADMASSNLSLH